LYPELVDIAEHGDTTYLTVTPTVLPLVAPLHGIGLKPLADLIEPALRVLIEQTGYNRSISPGQVTGFRLIPVFNPITLAVDLLKAVPQGINQMIAGLRGEPTWIVPAPPETLQDTTSQDTATPAAGAKASVAQRVSAADKAGVAEAPDTASVTDTDVSKNPTQDATKNDEAEAPAEPLRATKRGQRDVTDRVTETSPPRDDDEAGTAAGDETQPDQESTSRPDRKSERVAAKAERKRNTDTDAAA
jgi:hypothetical protein